MDTQGKCLLLALGALVLPGCGSLHPIVQYGHTSHAMQHMREHPQNHGFDSVGAGIRYRKGKLDIDLTENYTPEGLDSQHEVFEARITYELK